MSTVVVTTLAQFYGAALATAIIWWVPFVMSFIKLFQDDALNPEGRPKDTKVSSN
jgi:hypothetical protein